MRISPVNSYSTAALRNRNSQKPSFEGHSEQLMKRKSDGSHYYSLTGINLSEMAEDPDIAAYGYYLEIYNKKVNPYIDFQRGQYDNDSSVYLADPEEKLTRKIYENNCFVAVEKKPPLPSLEQLEEKFKSKKAVLYPFERDIELLADYNNRYIQTQNSPDEESLKTVKVTNELSEAVKLNTEDLKKRDELAETIDFIEKNYNNADRKLKEIEVEKYLLDERTDKINEELKKVNKIEDEERKKYGSSYNTTYPPSQTYYHRAYLENQRRDNIEKSAELQKQYDKYLNLKNNGTNDKNRAEEELNRIHKRLTQSFENIKRIYKKLEKSDN